VIAHKGIYAAFMCHAILALVTAMPTALIPFGPLHAKLGVSACGGGGGGAGSGSSDGSQGVVKRDGANLGGRSHTEVELLRAGRSPGCDSTQPETAGQDWGAWPPGEQHRGSGDRSWGSTGSRGAGAEEAAADMERQPLLLGPAGGASVEKKSHPQREAGSKDGGFFKGGVQQGGPAAGPAHQHGSSQEFHHHQHQHRQQDHQAALETGSPPREEGQPGQPSVHYWDGMRRLLLNPHALVFYGMVLVMGFGVGNIEGYLFLYLDSLGERTAAAPHTSLFICFFYKFYPLQCRASVQSMQDPHARLVHRGSSMVCTKSSLCFCVMQTDSCWSCLDLLPRLLLLLLLLLLRRRQW
jgi:hypothetical protein